ncbi:MAG: hypothetical protein AAGA48_37485 [Myxococcota bacterium]
MMLRIPSTRTGVEILGTESTHFVPIGPPYSPVLTGDFISVNAGLFAHPALWAHEIRSTNGQQLLGYFILCPGDKLTNDRFLATQTVLADAGPLGVDAAYFGFRPGEEHWIWLGNPWPNDFVLRGLDFPIVLTASLLGQPRYAYPIDQFAPGAPFKALTGERWEIRTDPGAPPVGYLGIDEQDDAQVWAADPKALFQRLIPPFKDGRWRFRKASTATPNTFVPLTRRRLGRIDLASRN